MWLKEDFVQKSLSQLLHAVPVSLLAPYCLLYLHPQRHSETLSDLGSINSLEANNTSIACFLRMKPNLDIFFTHLHGMAHQLYSRVVITVLLFENQHQYTSSPFLRVVEKVFHVL